jgi:predicted enzyme related to lactoylglutathione lyase
MSKSIPFLGLRTVIYRVKDLDEAKAFYTTILGFPPYFDEPFYVGYEVAGYELGLQSYETSNHATDNVETYWGVDDIQTVYNQLVTEGATPHDAPNEVGGGIWVALLKDPSGNILGLIKNPHFKLA